MLFIIVCAIFVPFGFASIEANCLPPKEVKTLRVIGKTLGYKLWDFKEDPCTGFTVVNKTHEADVVSERKVIDDMVVCSSEPNATICHVVAVSLKGQSLPGTLPPEFANLRYLKNIDLTYNFLNGTIPIEWGSLEQVTHISLLGNRITGSIPKELGNIRTLVQLIVEDNLMSGVIPEELGNLANIEFLFLNSNYFTGKLPASFASLTNMQQFRIGSNNFSGKIPDYIGKWKNLSHLSIQGSGLEGPIPSTITLLTNLSDLRISDLKGPDTFCPPFSNNISMKYLILRSCNLIGQLPESLSKSLKVVDLSFNKFNGTIPQEFFIALKNAEYIYLTGNLLSGSVPADWKLQQGKNIDLSYNNFTPESSSDLRCHKTNLFASSSKDNISKEVSCVGNVDCATHSSSLYINCGGKALWDGDKKYESDLEQGGASYFSSTDNRWGFSNTGHFLGANTTNTFLTNTSGVPVNISELYTSARISALSLTYYGFCMLNGSYIVSLHFAEIIFTKDKSYRSLGRRVFDIYIQGTLVQKDFDISDQARGIGKVIVKTYTVDVTNTLEIRLYWAGKGTFYIPRAGVYGPLISAISVNLRNKKGVPVGTVAGIVVGAVCLIALTLGVLWWWGFFGRRDTMELELNCYTVTFTLRQLKTATNNFDVANKIGEGGFGSVYKGVLPNGTLIAVKQLSSKSRQGNREFMNELGMISALQHPNLVTLHGCCIEENQLLLAYEYMENNSLARALFGPEEWQLELNWRTRYIICVGIAKGLAFLHEESRLKIVHRDIKATNVLLDKNLNAKISDFGLAKLDEEDNTHISTRIAGTYGYMAPEYAMRGYLTDKADVYSYGIVLLEIVSGMANTVDRTKENHFILLDRAISLNQTNNLIDLVDPKLGSEYDIQEMMVVINIALACTAITSTDRPTMSSVVSMLEARIVPRAFAVKKSLSMTEIDTEKFMKKLESKNGSQMQEISITCSNSSSSAVDLYPEELVSDCLQKRDNEANRLLS